jgi:hypothetical protein
VKGAVLNVQGACKREERPGIPLSLLLLLISPLPSQEGSHGIRGERTVALRGDWKKEGRKGEILSALSFFPPIYSFPHAEHLQLLRAHVLDEGERRGRIRSEC